MAANPSLEELREKYKNVMENTAVTRISNWTLPNQDIPTDEAEYVENVKNMAPELLAKVDEAIKKLKP